MTDSELLAEYSHNRSQKAFAGLVERYVRLVYSACRRQLRDTQLAEDASQMVFMLLSRKAAKLQRTELSGWLLTTAHYTCANMRRSEQRRRIHQQAVVMKDANPISEPNSELLEILDEGLLRLSAADRAALVLRFLQDEPLRQVGQSLGLSEDTARKRVERGLEKLRQFFRERGVQTDSATLAIVLTNQSRDSVADSLTHRIIHAPTSPAVAPTVAAAAIHTGGMVAASVAISAIVGVATWGVLHTPSRAAIPVAIPLATPATKPSLSAAERQRIVAEIIRCGADMQQIGRAMLDYAKSHEGHFPADLGSLIIAEEISPQLFVCPSSNTRVPPELLNEGLEAQAAWVNRNSDYLYLGKGKKSNGSPDTIVLYEKDADHGGHGMNMLSADGHVAFYSPVAVAHQYIQKQQAPKK